LFSLSYFAAAPLKIYDFELVLPPVIEGRPGETVVVEGGIINRGMFWLHKFTLTLSNLPYPYEIIPDYFEHVRILRAWDSVKGTHRVPINFTIKIYLPQDATGIYLVNLTGQEHRSWRKVAKSSTFILRVLTNVTITPNVTVSDLTLPEIVRAGEPFNLSFWVTNLEPVKIDANLSVEVPKNWEIDERTKTISLEPNTSEELKFKITPSETSGNVVVYLEYPYGVMLFNLTKYGPFLVPVTEVPEIPVEVEKPLLERIIEGAKRISPVIWAVIGLITLIVVWNILKIYKFYTGRRKPERVKKEVEEPETPIYT
jgi:uncharacterized membrane protein